MKEDETASRIYSFESQTLKRQYRNDTVTVDLHKPRRMTLSLLAIYYSCAYRVFMLHHRVGQGVKSSAYFWRSWASSGAIAEVKLTSPSRDRVRYNQGLSLQFQTVTPSIKSQAEKFQSLLSVLHTDTEKCARCQR